MMIPVWEEENLSLPTGPPDVITPQELFSQANLSLTTKEKLTRLGGDKKKMNDPQARVYGYRKAER